MIVSADDAHKFSWAVTKAEDWLGNGADYSDPPVGPAIEEACTLMAGCRDAMPEGLYRRIKDMAVLLYLMPPQDTRYSTGAACLRRILAKLKEKFPFDWRHRDRQRGQRLSS